jgi:hypothetical protein
MYNFKGGMGEKQRPERHSFVFVQREGRYAKPKYSPPAVMAV